MIKRLKHWWKNFEYWRWPPKREKLHYHCCCTSCIKGRDHIYDDKPLVQEPSQGLHEVEIDPIDE